MLRKLIFVFITLFFFSIQAVGGDLDLELLYGEWSKEYILQKGVRNGDPRWELTIVFKEDARFIYNSKSTTEKWLTGGGVEAIIEETKIEGTWHLAGENLVLIVNQELTSDQFNQLAINLGYSAKLQKAVLSYELREGLLKVWGEQTARQLFLKKTSSR